MGGVDLGLITDSAADLSPKVLQEEAVGLVPIYVHFLGRRYKDWQELTPDALYQAMRAGAEPVTELPGVEDFAEVYERYLHTTASSPSTSPGSFPRPWSGPGRRP
jgi:fatty acid-binding protein DegV